MQLCIDIDDSEVAGVLTFLKICLAGEKRAEWQKALLALVTINNPEQLYEVLLKRCTSLPLPAFPLYEMVVDGKEKFLPFREAYVAFDSGWMPVDTGEWVLEKGFRLRLMTPEDKKKISDAADEYSASK